MTAGAGGRPTSYKPEYCELAYNYCLLGATDVQLASFFDVAESTIHKWKHDFPEFSESLKRGKAEADARVAAATFHRATGYSHQEDKIFLHDGEPVVVTTVKHYPPDPVSCIFWLKNRQPERWTDKQKIDADVTAKMAINIIDKYEIPKD